MRSNKGKFFIHRPPCQAVGLRCALLLLKRERKCSLWYWRRNVRAVPARPLVLLLLTANYLWTCGEAYESGSFPNPQPFFGLLCTLFPPCSVIQMYRQVADTQDWLAYNRRGLPQSLTANRPHNIGGLSLWPQRKSCDCKARRSPFRFSPVPLLLA